MSHLHLATSVGLIGASIDVLLQPLYILCRRLSRCCVAWNKLKKRQQEVVGGVSSELEGTGEVKCEGSASAADRWALKLRAPVKTQ